jgi:GNAT superfamily N-acetyltransferase
MQFETDAPRIGCVSVRIATEDDREFIYQVKKAAYGRYITEQFGWDEDKQRWYHRQDWEDRHPAVIEVDGVSVGSIWIAERDDGVEIGEFFVHPDRQGEGIGTVVMNAVLSQAQGRTVHLARLKVNPVWRFYERFGFSDVGEDGPNRLMRRDPSADKGKT